MLGKKLLEGALKKLYNLEFASLTILEGPHGKPYIKEHPEIGYNISHSGEYVVLAVSDIPVGIDIQEVRKIDIDQVARRVMSPEEYAALCVSLDKETGFFKSWVLKESYVKWTGDGMTNGFSNLPMDGWYQFIDIANRYFCAIRAAVPLQVSVKEVTMSQLEARKF